MKFIDSVFQKLRSHPKRVVFPEGTEPRVLAAAAEFVQLGLGVAVLLGKRDEIEAAAQKAKSRSTRSSSSIRERGGSAALRQAPQPR